MQGKQLKELEESFDSGIISKEEYEKKKKEIEELPEPVIEEKKEEDVPEVKLKADKMLIIGAIVLVLIFTIILGLRFFTEEEQKTIDELHELNLKGKLKDDQGYLYKGVYSFVNVEDVWYAQLMSPSGSTLFNFNFRYSPRDLEDIKIKGTLDTKKFNEAKEYFVTFNPLGTDFTHIQLARFDFDIQMTKVFQKTPKSACDRNATPCSGVPIITCDNTDEIVVYYKESNDLSVEYDDNCIIISGLGFDLVKGVDRVLYNFYDIMDQ